MVWYNYNGVLSKSKWRLFNQSGILSVSRDSYVWFYEYFYVFLLSYGWSKKRFSYLHSTVNGTFDIDFCSIIIIKLRRKNNISSPAGASQQERDKDHFSVFLLQIKSTLYNTFSLTIFYCMDFRCSGPSPPAWNIIPFFAMRDERPWPLCL